MQTNSTSMIQLREIDKTQIHYTSALPFVPLNSFSVLISRFIASRSVMLGITLLKSPRGRLNEKSIATRIKEKKRYQPDIQNVKTKAPAALMRNNGQSIHLWVSRSLTYNLQVHGSTSSTLSCNPITRHQHEESHVDEEECNDENDIGPQRTKDEEQAHDSHYREKECCLLSMYDSNVYAR